MKKLSTLEAASQASNISVKEMLEDIKKLNSWETGNDEKKQLAAKYGIQSRKTAEIEKGILTRAAESRSQRNKFDEDDVIAFLKMINYIEVYNKLEAYLLDEPESFVKFLKEFIENKLTEENLIQYATWKSSDLKYRRIPYGKIYNIKLYQSLIKFLESHGTDNKDARDAKTKATELVLEKLNEQLKDFKNDLLDRAEEQALAYYDDIIKNLTKWKKEADKLEQSRQDYIGSCKGYYLNDYDYKILEKKAKIAKAKYVQGKYVKGHFTKEEYGTYCRKQAESEYEMKKHTMAEKIVARDFDYANLQFTNVKRDPKWIEMLITDGVKKVYARSIIAAEFSEKVTVHFRFILTDRK